MRVRFGFLYENFRDATFWYESFGMLRKASMVAVVTLLRNPLPKETIRMARRSREGQGGVEERSGRGRGEVKERGEAVTPPVM